MTNKKTEKERDVAKRKVKSKGSLSINQEAKDPLVKEDNEKAKVRVMAKDSLLRLQSSLSPKKFRACDKRSPCSNNNCVMKEGKLIKPLK